MSKHTPDQIDRLAERMRQAIEVDGTHYRHIGGMVVASWADELHAYAATLRQCVRVPGEADEEFVPRWWDDSHGNAYIEGWNDCRKEMLGADSQQ